MIVALTRSVPPAIVDCELTHFRREAIDPGRAAEQHGRYEEALAALGCTVRRLPPLPDLPDSVFVEDAAVVLPELAIITRPGAASRRSEVPSVAEALRAHRPLAHIEVPGTLDGGDVLRIGGTIYVGHSTRTSAEGIRQLTELVSGHGYAVRPVEVSGCLHLKTAVTQVAEAAVLINPSWVDASCFGELERIDIHPDEPHAANALWTGEAVLYLTSHPRTRRRLERRGIRVHPIDMDELEKAEAGVTCCSILIFERPEGDS
jgi:dimethylargininase